MKQMLSLLILILPWMLPAQSWSEALVSYRTERVAGLLADSRQPVDSLDSTGIQWFEPDEHYRLPCRVEILAEAERLEIPTYSGIQKTFRPVARVHFQLQGQALSLTLYSYVLPPALSRMEAPYFLPFKDQTNGDLTYGGGRYLDIDRGDLTADTFILDLNRAYNPLCAYADGFNCPIPPRDNHLPLEIMAGEKVFTGTYKHRD